MMGKYVAAPSGWDGWRKEFARISTIALLLASSSEVLAQQPARADAWRDVTSALGRAGAAQPGGVMKYSFPRSDLTVVVGGVTLKPALALGSWVAFREVAPGMAMVMGDLVLTEDEVGPVMRTLQSGGVQQTALHNHLLNESPHVMYMHIAAFGDATRIARTVHDALARSHTPIGTAVAAAPATNTLDTAAIARLLGRAGKLSGVVYQVAVARSERITEEGHEVPPSMGVATSINFQPTGGNRAAISGDFVLRDKEVNPVIKALLAHGIQPVAIHSHMLGEQPRLYFMHYWADDDVTKLATGLRAALDLTASKKGGS